MSPRVCPGVYLAVHPRLYPREYPEVYPGVCPAMSPESPLEGNPGVPLETRVVLGGNLGYPWG